MLSPEHRSHLLDIQLSVVLQNLTAYCCNDIIMPI